MSRPAKTCSVDGCERKHNKHGYCVYHFYRFKNYGDPLKVKRQVNRYPSPLCSVPGCNSPHKAKGFCWNHYCQQKSNGTLGSAYCNVDGCERTTYAKGLCRKHWARQDYLNKHPDKRHQCNFPGCARVTFEKYCSRHIEAAKSRKHRHIPLTTPDLRKGEFNHNWHGGVAEYPNHSEFKRNRKIKLQQVNNLCELCGQQATNVHHKDGSKTNHAVENLEALCRKCHLGTYHSKPHTSKYSKIYGSSLAELSRKLNMHVTTVVLYHRAHRLHDLMNGVIAHIPNRIKGIRKGYQSRGTKFKRLYGMTIKELAIQLHTNAAYVHMWHKQGILASKLDHQLITA